MATREITVEQLEQVLAAGAQLVDVRETDEYEAGHVPGAVHVPLATVADHFAGLVADGVTYVICKSGGRSLQACRYLDERGMQAVNIEGGTTAWMLSGRPTVLGGSPS